jgi:hypothetical protein
MRIVDLLNLNFLLIFSFIDFTFHLLVVFFIFIAAFFYKFLGLTRNSLRLLKQILFDVILIICYEIENFHSFLFQDILYSYEHLKFFAD